MSIERTGVFQFDGKPLTLMGPELKVGEKAPDFTVLDTQLNPAGLKDFKGKIKLLSVVTSLDTSVCYKQAEKFNKGAAALPAGIEVINISMDLPFAIARFMETAAIDRLKAYSDYKGPSFGLAYGVLIKELRLLARSVFVIDNNDIIRYIEIVKEGTNYPDFDTAFAEATKLA